MTITDSTQHTAQHAAHPTDPVDVRDIVFGGEYAAKHRITPNSQLELDAIVDGQAPIVIDIVDLTPVEREMLVAMTDAYDVVRQLIARRNVSEVDLDVEFSQQVTKARVTQVAEMPSIIARQPRTTVQLLQEIEAINGDIDDAYRLYVLNRHALVYAIGASQATANTNQALLELDQVKATLTGQQAATLSLLEFIAGIGPEINAQFVAFLQSKIGVAEVPTSVEQVKILFAEFIAGLQPEQASQIDPKWAAPTTSATPNTPVLPAS